MKTCLYVQSDSNSQKRFVAFGNVFDAEVPSCRSQTFVARTSSLVVLTTLRQQGGPCNGLLGVFADELAIALGAASHQATSARQGTSPPPHSYAIPAVEKGERYWTLPGAYGWRHENRQRIFGEIRTSLQSLGDRSPFVISGIVGKTALQGLENLTQLERFVPEFRWR